MIVSVHQIRLVIQPQNIAVMVVHVSMIHTVHTQRVIATINVLVIPVPSMDRVVRVTILVRQEPQPMAKILPVVPMIPGIV